MSCFEITRADGSISRMRLINATDPIAEIAKWSPEDQETVVSVHAVDEHLPREGQEIATLAPVTALPIEQINAALRVQHDKLISNDARKLTAYAIKAQIALNALAPVPPGDERMRVIVESARQHIAIESGEDPVAIDTLAKLIIAKHDRQAEVTMILARLEKEAIARLTAATPDTVQDVLAKCLEAIQSVGAP
jgi:hypothetical protein